MTEQATTHNTLSANLADWTIQLIRAEGLGRGDALPTARDLAQRFGVSTPTMREALRSLQATEIVEIKHGSGIYVGPNIGRTVLPNRNAGVLSPERFDELLEARLLVEPRLAELAAGNRTPEQVHRLRECLERAAGRIGDDAALHTENMDFHRLIAEAAGNSVLAEVVDSLLSVHGPEQRQILHIYNDRERDHAEHLDILAAIEAGKPVVARRLITKHLEVVREIVAANVSEES
ncbi:FadR/GntR family transcriptional regulator [Sciscionella marina]|uniref:FadR/GntR family transcriptional regulator n=1 Tax=Sciscionella marina TaxID=508770 RepID=UPI0004761699|nr:FadR/GntR family transcriptional regulator [Sciscionella marina]